MNRGQRRAQAKTSSASKASGQPGLRELFAQAVSLHQAMRLSDAERLYRRVLAIDQRHFDSLHLLGVIAAQSDRHDQAAELIGRAIAIRSDFAAAHGNLGVALRALGRNQEAVAAHRRAIALEPDYAEAHYNLGIALQELGFNDQAIAAYHRAIGLKPDYAEAHYNLGIALQALARDEDAAAAYRRSIELKPDYAEAHNNLGVMLQRLGREHEAIAAYHRAIDLKPDYAEARNNLGLVLQNLGHAEDAISAYRLAIDLKPDYVVAYINQGIALQELGRSAQAMASLDQALAIDPASAHAWYIRRDLKTFGPGDADLDQMEALLAKTDAGAAALEDRLDLEFALGKAWMDVGDAERAFAHLDAGNRLKRASLTYDVETDLARFAAIARSFTPDLMRRFAGAGDPSGRPVFVIGMPRSGTTLVEQILASHPEIHGAGELTTLDEAVGGVSGPDYTAEGDPERLTAAARVYVDQVGALAPGKRRVVDKMPANFLFAGLIHLMLPNARIIHCRRDAVDTCLSCYSKKFTGRQDFSYDPRELGLYYRGYEGLMAHWRAMLPPTRFIEVDYEDVVGDLEGQARRLIAFCGLDWDPACLGFHATPRQVRTASASQVRQPLYSAGVGRWKSRQIPRALLDALGL